jgi:hypothetical protein
MKQKVRAEEDYDPYVARQGYMHLILVDVFLAFGAVVYALEGKSDLLYGLGILFLVAAIFHSYRFYQHFKRTPKYKR